MPDQPRKLPVIAAHHAVIRDQQDRIEQQEQVQALKERAEDLEQAA